MSDFLGNLVARAMAQPALRPRTRSRFEPAGAEEVPLVWPEAKRVGSATEGPPIAAGEDAEEKEAQEPPAIERNPARSPQLHAPLSPTEPVVRDTPRTETRVVREVQHDAERAGETPEREVAVPAPQLPAAAQPRGPRQHRFDRQPPRIIERHVPPRDAEQYRDREIRTAIERPPRIVREKSPAASAAGAAEPVIEVSIGRIEVRAVTAAAPARPAARNSAMSIDDYVAKRKAKERR
jgi:hypothetical protein